MPKDAALAAEAAAPPAARRRSADAGARTVARSAFHAADIRALRIAYYMRFGAMGAIAIWLMVLIGFPEVLFYYAMFVVFIALAYFQYKAGKAANQPLLYALILADFLFLAFAVLVDNPMSTAHFPPGTKLNQSRDLYFFVLLAGVSACHQPRRVIWGGVCAMTAWTLGFLWQATQPGAVTVYDTGQAPDLESWIVLVANPYFVDHNRLIEALVVMAIVTAILAMVALQARQLVRAQIVSTRERANLARYFAPAIVEELATHDTPFEAVKAERAAVLFADVVGFTAMAQHEPPERIIGFLRALHQRLEGAIFEHGGTLDKYMGDGVMAIFGAPRAAPDDACRAIAAARAIQDATADWNAARAAANLPPVAISVGVHYGAVVSGDIGSERRLEFATIGDAVNLASRLESATRRLDAAVAISAETAAQAEREDPTRAEALLRGFRHVSAVEIPGHAAADVLVLSR